MKAQTQHQPQDDQQQWQEARALLDADPAYVPWSETGHALDTMSFDEWLTSPQGIAWLESEESADEESHCLTTWEGW